MITNSGDESGTFDDDHAEILAAIKAGDARTARDCMAAHLLRVREDRLKCFSAGTASGGST
jgi:DNA-binding GntR family transcriptional regulator